MPPLARGSDLIRRAEFTYHSRQNLKVICSFSGLTGCVGDWMSFAEAAGDADIFALCCDNLTRLDTEILDAGYMLSQRVRV